MKLSKKMTLALAMFAIAGASYAQETTTSDSGNGVLGTRYLDANLTVSSIKRISSKGYDLGVGANIPVTNFLDVGAGYDYSWLNASIHSSAHTLSTSATAYMTSEGVKPFATAALGYTWLSFKAPLKSDTEFGLWGFAVGVEIPENKITLTPTISYSDDTQGSATSAQAYTYGVEGNYWINKQWGVYASVDYSNSLHSSFDSWDYTIGARWKF